MTTSLRGVGGDEWMLGNGVAAGGDDTPGGALTGGALPYIAGPASHLAGRSSDEAAGGDPAAIGDGS